MVSAPEVDLYSRMANHGVVVAIEEPLILYRLHTGSSVDTTFFEGRVVHRYVAACEQARLSNERRPTFDEFRAQEAAAPLWRRLRVHMKDMGQFRYRSAGVHIAEGQMISGAASLATAALVSPRFVATRLWQRRFSQSARQTMHEGNIDHDTA
jgi:hypothetical protein